MIQGSNYQERYQSQFDQWVEGNSLHNEVDDECCPDFSCCEPSLQTPKEARIKYLTLNPDEMTIMLHFFLSNAVSKSFSKYSTFTEDENWRLGPEYIKNKGKQP